MDGGTAKMNFSSFLKRNIFSMDHKVIGKQYLITSFFMALIGGLLALYIRLQLGWPKINFRIMGNLFPGGFENGVLKPDFYIGLVTIHGTIMVFFFLSLALISGFGNYIIPLQIGARDMASPLLNMLSYWIIIPSCLLMLISLYVEGGPAASGWTAYPPLSAVKSAISGSGAGQTIWLISMALFIVSFTLGGLNFVTTILAFRTKGLHFSRLPLFCWAIFLVSIIGLLSFPPLTAGAIMLLFDRHFQTSFFLPEKLYIGGKLISSVGGGSPLLWQHLFWFLGHPEVYVLMLPSLALAVDIISVFAKKRVFGYNIIYGSFIIITALSFIVWGHHMYTSGMNPFLGKFFAVTTLLISIPSGIIVFCILATLYKSNITLTTPMLFALAIISLFIAGGLGGLYLAATPTDIFFHDTYFVVGHFHLIMAGAAIFGIFAGTYYWFPKMFRKYMNETLGKIHFYCTFIPYYLTFLPMQYLGIKGMLRRVYDPTTYEYTKPFQSINTFISISAIILISAQLLFVFNFFWGIKYGKKAPANAWNANTLEWQTDLPPPNHHPTITG